MGMEIFAFTVRIFELQKQEKDMIYTKFKVQFLYSSHSCIARLIRTSSTPHLLLNFGVHVPNMILFKLKK